MANYEDFLKIDGKVFRLEIVKELFELRKRFCNGVCKECSIHQTYHIRGVSCNEALSMYPENTASLMNR